MMDTVRRVIYNPSVNYVLRNAMKPFKPLLSYRMQIPVAGIITVPVKGYGTLRFDTNQTNQLTKDLFWDGIHGYEYPIIRVLMDICRKKSSMIDIGANIGYFGLISALVNPKMRVYAFEPMPAAAHYMQKNIDLNNMQASIEVIRAAVGDEITKAEFFVTKNPKALHLEHHIGGSSTMARPKDKYSQTITVDVTTIDAFMEERKLEDIDIIKMDTEATEDSVLRGGWKTIEAHKPIIICEVLPNRIEDEIERLFSELGYVFFLPVTDGLQRLDTVKNLDTDKDFFFVHIDNLEEVEHHIL